MPRMILHHHARTRTTATTTPAFDALQAKFGTARGPHRRSHAGTSDKKVTGIVDLLHKQGL